MNFYRHWVRETALLELPEGRLPIHAWGRSDLSTEDARRDARERLDRVQRKMRGERIPERQDYAADIREEVVRRFDDGNVISRNRYGALIWNSRDHVILDIDQPRPGFHFLEWLGLRPRLNDRERIEHSLRRLLERPEYAAATLRVYDTARGVRVIARNLEMAPESREFRRLSRLVHADDLYTHLCAKQLCFRARLTPKPYRLGCGAFRFQHPLPDTEEEAARQWLKRYEEASRGKAVCALRTVMGPDAPNTALLDFHDDFTRARSGLPLA